MAHETELKLSLDAQAVPQLLSHPLLAAPALPQRLLNTYFDTPDLARQARLMAVRPALRPLFATDFERRRWFIDHAGARIEVALDQGRVHVPGTALEAILLELELELLEGPDAALLALADALRQTAHDTVKLTPSDVSKAQRGLVLWQRARA